MRVGSKARDDLIELYDWIGEQAGFDVADRYIGRIERVMASLADMPARGTPRNDLVAGLRTIASERRATIAYTISGTTVTIQRVLHAGRDLRRAFDD